jgi:hypothetical protein
MVFMMSLALELMVEEGARPSCQAGLKASGCTVAGVL